MMAMALMTTTMNITKNIYNCNDAVFDNSGADLLYVGFHMQTKFELYNLAQNHFSFCT